MIPTGESREYAEALDGAMAERAGLAERAGQWSRLAELLADASAGGGCVAMVTGPVGSGKTELLHSFAEHAGAAGFRFVKITCSRAERTVPFGLVGQLFRQVEPPAEVASKVATLMESVGPATDGGPDLGWARHFLSQAVLDLIGDNRLLIGVDDVRDADPESLDWLLCLIRRLDSARVLLVLTEPVTPRRAHSPLHDELLRHPYCHRIRLAPLSFAGVTTLASRHLDGPRARRFAASAYAISGGNPLLISALLDDHPGSGSAAAEAGPHFRQALLSCLYRCEPTVLTTARALAILGDTATYAQLAHLTGADIDMVTSATDVMNVAGLLEDGWFRDPAAREALLDDMAPAVRKELHLTAGRLLFDRGVSAEQVAPHLVATGAVATWTVPVLAEAAEQALAGERIDAALEYLELAGRGCADPADKASIAARLARVEWRINPAAAARRLSSLTSTLADGHRTAQDAAVLVRQLLWHGRSEAAAEVFQQASAAPDGERATELWLSCTYPSMIRRGRPNRGPRTQDAIEEPWHRAVSALAGVLAGRVDGRWDAVAEGVLQGARPSDSGSWGVEAAVTALLALVYADRLDSAKSWCEWLLDESGRHGTPVSRALFLAIRGEIALRQSDLPVAFSQAKAALDELPPASWGTTVGFPLGCLITAATRMGRHADAVGYLEIRVPDAMFSGRDGLHYLHARGGHYLATGRHHAALADFLACGELMTSWGLDTPALVPWRTSAAEAWLRHGADSDEAGRLLNEQLARLGPDGCRTRGVALRLLAATSQIHRRIPLLDEAVAILTECGDRFELAKALADLSRTHRALRDHRRAWTIARKAWQAAKACHATELCTDLLPNSTTPESADRGTKVADGIESLTNAERRVAALASFGFTNREIADKLFITPSTIEQHLTKVYRKLNVKYRTDLPEDLHAGLLNTDLACTG
jgi:DNA-binding CsgD family transcriptional regulator